MRCSFDRRPRVAGAGAARGGFVRQHIPVDERDVDHVRDDGRTDVVVGPQTVSAVEVRA
jgi:hypothetical protein